MFSFIFDLFTNFISFFTISLINIKNYFLLNCNNNIENLNIFSYIFYVFCDKFSNFFLTNSDTVWAKVLYELDGKYSVSQTKEEYVQHYLENLKNEENESKISNLCRKYGFPKPLNPHMECVILMYHENCTVMAQILLGIIVYLIVALFLFTNRSLKDVQKTSKHIEYLIDLGFIWIPTSIIFDLAGMGVGYILHLDFVAVNLKTSLTVEIMGHQWYWWYTLDADVVADQFKFLNSYLFNEFLNNHLLMTRRRDVEIELRQFLPLEEITRGNFLAVNLPMVLPVKEHVRFFISARDVIHSWTVPQLGVKVDAIPGRINQFFVYSYFTGMYFGMCSELCGVYHAFMPICIEFQKGAIFFLFCMLYRNGNIVDPNHLKKQFETAITLE
jgi:heme/copper-type cytochrome/quinol oxidase subunit 2